MLLLYRLCVPHDLTAKVSGAGEKALCRLAHRLVLGKGPSCLRCPWPLCAVAACYLFHFVR